MFCFQINSENKLYHAVNTHDIDEWYLRNLVTKILNRQFGLNSAYSSIRKIYILG